MQREGKQLEASLDALLSQVADLKNSLGSFIYKLENEYDRLTWPSVLDSFALLSGQLNTLNKVLKHEKTPLFRNQVIIPLVLSPDRDEDLMRQTEGRVPVFSHEVVPDHLRTKPDPEVEEQEKQLTTDAARIGADVAQREEKQLEASLDALLSQVADLKNSLGSFIYKLENEYDRLTWPSVLDSFALLSGQLNTLNKVLKHEKTPLFRNQVIIPLVLSPDRDEDLMRQTEGRVPVFSHEVVPDHLRTKPDPEVEEQEKQLTTDAARIGADVAQKQIQSLNKMCSNLLEKISKEERESESGGLRPNKQTFNPADTNALVAAVAFGKGLSNWRPSGSSGSGQPGQPGTGTILTGASGLQQVQMTGAPSQQQSILSGVQMAQAGQPGKMPSGIKTNIKSASMHPYQW
ncbi:Mediator of RNA polymerase II transcription subunit 8 [Myotis brandtii]|uniref:Mediator of RNA polymerase II transcription subunit 8 n=1 Tax=Myotis brandtii TaxID=109478 RepID=S7MW68_MYOBR|nr:Mediator of RNA polymerase II transcription subunit 8 [Myotis brandtii]